MICGPEAADRMSCSMKVTKTSGGGKMKKSIFKKAAVIALSVATIMTFSFASVFAATASSGTATGDGTNAAVYLTKQLQMPVGTTTPTKDYTFSFTQNTDKSVATVAIADKTISFTSADAGSASDKVKTVTKQSTNITSGLSFTQEGVYTYTVKETTTAANSDTAKETVDSNTTYTLRLYVKSAETTGKYYVDKASVIKTVDSDGVAIAENDANKIDASVQTDSTNGFIFTGKYKEFVIAGAFQLVNTISDVYKTAPDADTSRTYSITVMIPTFTSTDTAVTSVIAIQGAGTEVSFTSGTAQDVTLTKGQALKFTSLPVGTVITVTDPSTTAMTPSYIQTVGGTSAAAKAGSLGAEQTSTQTITSGTAISDTNSVMNGYVNGLEFINTWATMSVTGVVVENMPFILMGIALAGAALLLIMRRRREQDEE